MLFLFAIIIGLIGCKDENVAPANIEFFEGTWITAQETYSGWYHVNRPDILYYRAQVIKITRCEGNDCYLEFGYTKNYTYDYKIEIGVVDEDSPDPLVTGQLINTPQVEFVRHWNILNNAQLVDSNIGKREDTLGIVRVTKDSLILRADYLLENKILSTKFKRAML